MITALVVWGAIPFVTITVYAGWPRCRELVEAAAIDGARAWRVFRDVTLPLLKPIFVILTSLSIIWDFQVFNQVWIMLDSSPTPDYYLMSIYSFVKSFRGQRVRARLGDRGRDGAIMLVVTSSTSGRWCGSGEAAMRREPPAVAGSRAGTPSALLVFVVMIFPVYWMVATAFKPGQDIFGYTPQWFPTHPTLVNFTRRDQPALLLGRVKNSLIIVSAVVALSLVLAFLAALALAKFRFYGRRGVHRDHHRRPDGPAQRADHPALPPAREGATRSTS